MNIINQSNLDAPSPAEVARRVNEFRALGFARRAPAQVVYQEAYVLCPWPGCGHRIDGIRFQLEHWCEPALLERLLEAWWKGPGLIGRCPKCSQWVLFGPTEKTAAMELDKWKAVVLPEEWQTNAHIVTKG